MHKQHSIHRLKNLQLSCALAACTVALAACGGGGGGGGETPPPAVDPSVAMRGFWGGTMTGAPDGATRSAAVVMADGTAWVVLESATAPTAVARIPLTGTGVNTTDATVTGNGFYYRLGDGARLAVSASGTASTKGTFKGTATANGTAPAGFDWTSVPGFTTPAQAADVVGTWAGTAGAGAVTITWSVSAAGAVTGSSSTGCAYSGTLRPAAGTAVYDLSVAEDCAGTVRALSGIATLFAGKTSLRAAFTTDSGTKADLVVLGKQ